MKPLNVRLVLALAIVTLAALPLGPLASARTAAPAATTIQVRGGEFFFRLSKKSAPHGTVTFVMRNIGTIAHDFKIDGKKTRLLMPGKSAKITVKLTKRGRYPYRCTVPGHAAAGMKGVFRVT